jgi:hypothetical protein
MRSLVLWIGSWASADLATRSRSRGDRVGIAAALELGTELAAAVTATMRVGNDPSNSAPAGPRLVLELAAAEVSRFDGGDDARIWESIGIRCERLGDLPRSVLARQRQAEDPP